MAEIINWMYSVRALSGPAASLAGQIQADGYQKLSVTVAAGATTKVTIGPDKWPGVLGLIVSASDPNGKPAAKISATPDGGQALQLDAPLILLGAGTVALLGAGNATLSFKNDGAVDALVDLFVVRDATP